MVKSGHRTLKARNVKELGIGRYWTPKIKFNGMEELPNSLILSLNPRNWEAIPTFGRPNWKPFLKFGKMGTKNNPLITKNKLNWGWGQFDMQLSLKEMIL